MSNSVVLTDANFEVAFPSAVRFVLSKIFSRLARHVENVSS